MPAQATTSAPAVPMELMSHMISQMMSKISDMVVTMKWNDAETMMEMQAAQDRLMKEIQATESDRISNLMQGNNLGHPSLL